MELEKVNMESYCGNKVLKYPNGYPKQYPEDCKEEINNCFYETRKQFSELEKTVHINPRDLTFNYDKFPGEKIKKKLDIFLSSDLDLFDLPALGKHSKELNVGYLLSAIYAIGGNYIEKFKDKMAKNPKSLKYISDNWEKGLKIDTMLQVSGKESSKLKKIIIDKCVERAKKGIDLKIDSILDKSNIKNKEKRQKLKKEILLSLDKAVKTGDNNDLSNLLIILDSLSSKSSDSLKLASELLGMKKTEIDLSNISLLDKLKQEKPELYDLLQEIEKLGKLRENNSEGFEKYYQNAQVLKQEALSKATNLEEIELVNSTFTSLKINQTTKIFENYSKNEKSSEIFLKAIKENKNISVITIDKAIKEQKIDLKTGKIDEKFLNEKGEINHNFTKEQFYEIKVDVNGFLKELPVGAELPVGETSNIQKNQNGTYDIKIFDKITGVNKFYTEYKGVDELKAKEIIKYINLFDEIGLSYLTPQLLKTGDYTLLKKWGIQLDGKTSITGNTEELKILQEISKMFFPEEDLKSDIYDLKLMFKQKLMTQGFMGIGFRGFAINKYLENPKKSIFDQNGMINPFKIL